MFHQTMQCVLSLTSAYCMFSCFSLLSVHFFILCLLYYIIMLHSGVFLSICFCLPEKPWQEDKHIPLLLGLPACFQTASIKKLSHVWFRPPVLRAAGKQGNFEHVSVCFLE